MPLPAAAESDEALLLAAVAEEVDPLRVGIETAPAPAPAARMPPMAKMPPRRARRRAPPPATERRERRGGI